VLAAVGADHRIGPHFLQPARVGRFVLSKDTEALIGMPPQPATTLS